MPGFGFLLIGSYSITIAVVIGLIRLPRIHKSYQPFIFILIAGLLNEICSTILISQGYSNAVPTNIVTLIEVWLWMWQFSKWNAFSGKRWLYLTLMIAMTSLWLTENVILGKLFIFSSWCSLVFSFCIVFLSISQANKQIVEEKRNLITNAKFLICSGAILFYTYRILVECFYLLQLEQSGTFLSNIFSILAFVNLFVNLLFAFATLWIPTRQRFSLPSS